MGDNCTENCSTCVSECDERKKDYSDFRENPHPMSNIKKVIGIVSGKGGVGKSLVTSMMAVTMQRRGYNVGIIDADITGPSIPKSFGIREKAQATEYGYLPVKSKSGIGIMSINLLLDNDTDPVVWRGPIIANTVKQFWKDVDYMFIDMPPGTGDVPLTVFQSIKIDGIIIVTSPQELVSMIVSKALKMARMMDVPILGIVENMSYFKCSTCDEEHKIFGESKLEDIANEYNIDILAKIPLNPGLSPVCDKGLIEIFKGDWLENAADILNRKVDSI
ncbi:Mrp family chromosome partitioning ATPase [Acetoanaerobium pronyense]|uniref:Iron-sulfur cluster carrier protein n=1 Tax=Acetoanaerobium pronyense TaxID=1482736 RepID=A0ABS4KG99_9FIRM|nr:Mrp/NBP35 family ATP-binding protein [Acetoanaerobium pronyense]MBP2026768.1 Mrp family chromosome partitioning ATPase [Acetoanaerobium pronyense]